MLHAPNFVVVIVVFIPVLTSSFPQNGQWKEMYERLQAARNPQHPDSLPISRGDGYVCCNQPHTVPPRPHRRIRLVPQDDATAGFGSPIESDQTLTSQGSPFYGRRFSLLQALALPMDNSEDRSGLLRRALEQLTQLQRQQKAAAAATSQALPRLAPVLLSSQGEPLEDRFSRRLQADLVAKLLGTRMVASPGNEALAVKLGDTRKRGDFVGAPGSAGGPNMFGR